MLPSDLACPAAYGGSLRQEQVTSVPGQVTDIAPPIMVTDNAPPTGSLTMHYWQHWTPCASRLQALSQSHHDDVPVVVLLRACCSDTV